MDCIQHCQVIQVEIVDYFSECFILDLTIEVNDKFLVFPCFLGDFVKEYLLEIVGFGGHDSDMRCDLLGAG